MKPLATVLAVLLAVPASAVQVERLRVARPLSDGGGFSESEVAAGEVLAQFAAGMTPESRDALLEQFGARFGGTVEGSRLSRVILPSGMPVSAGLSLLGGKPGIDHVAANGVYRALVVPNDLYYAQQYHLAKINAPAAWEYEVGSSSRVTIVVMDAGVEGSHPELQAKILAGSRDCSSGACLANDPPTMSCNHGTRVAGLAAAVTNNGSGISGVSWNARLLSLKVFANGDCNSQCCSPGGICSGAGNTCATTDAAMIAAINYAAGLNSATYGRVVLNMSIGAAETCGANGADMQNALTNAANAGVVLVAASGNISSGCSAVQKPANCANVIPVGATDSSDNVASFSCGGAELANNGVVAPGKDMTTTDLNGAIVSGGVQGTSFSAPVVAGLAGLILSAKPTFTPAQVKSTLRAGADGIGISAASANPLVPAGNTTGAGRVNAFRTMKLAVEGTLAGFAGDQKVIAFPNPFKTAETAAVTITVPVSLQGRGTSIRIYTIDGRLVRDLKAQTTWDGKNDGGHQVASGTYLVLVKTDAGTQTGKLAVIR